MKETRILIAYYSRRGQNYSNGKIVNLQKGNTAVVAEKIQKLTRGDLFEIRTIDPYPEDYTECTRVAKREHRDGVRPELAGALPDPEDYDILYLGYPNWWGTVPMPVFTFLESSDFSGKIIHPFCTHEGSGMGGEGDIRKSCPGARVMTGLAIRGSRSDKSDSDLNGWLES